MRTNKDYKTMVKWAKAFLGWLIVCLLSLTYLHWSISLGLWLGVTGIVMYVNREAYRTWYNRFYETEY